MAYCERLSEQLAVVATIDPITMTATASATSDVFSMEMHRRALFIFKTGPVLGAVSVLIQENVASAFTAGTGTLLSATTAAVTAIASQYLFEVSAAALSSGFTWLRAVIVGPVIGDCLDMTVLADVERYHPASDRDLPTVVSIQATA